MIGVNSRSRTLACLLLLLLYARPVQAQKTHTLTAGAGDGSVQITVNQYGSWNSFTYDPIGPLGPVKTSVLDSEVYSRFGPSGPRKTLSGPASIITGTPTSCTNTFTMGVLSFQLNQTVVPLMVMPGPVQNGMILTQTFVITNTSAAPVDFDMVRFLHPHLGGTQLGGGRLPGPPETFFLFDKNKSPTTLPLYITGQGGIAPATDRFEINKHSTIGSKIASGALLTDTVSGDFNADLLVDPGKEGHYAIGLRNVFTLAPLATATYTTTTAFGDGTIPIPTAGVSINQPTGETTVKEGGASDTYFLVLNTAPTSSVVITLIPDGQVMVTPSTITFTTGNWSTPQAITVTAVDDTSEEGFHIGWINHVSKSLDGSYDGIFISNVDVEIIDNDFSTEGSYAGFAGPPGLEGSFGLGNSFRNSKLLHPPAGAIPVLSGPFQQGNPFHFTVLNVSQRSKTPSTAQASSEEGLSSLWWWSLAGAGLVLLAIWLGPGKYLYFFGRGR